MALKGSFNTNSYDTGRYYTLSWEATQSIEKNTSTISWKLTTTGGKQWYAERTLKVVLAGKVLVDKTARVERWAGTIASGSFDLVHNEQGELSISGSVQAALYGSSVNVTGSSSWTLDKIPRGAILTAADNFTDEGNPTITYTNPLGDNVESVKACIANVDGTILYANYRDIDKSGTSYTFELTEQERENLRWGTINSNTMTVRFYVTSVVSGNTIYSTMDKILTIVNATPTFSSSVNDTGGASTALTGSNAGNVKMIKGFNYMVCSMTPTAYKGASIKSCKITNGANVVNDKEASFNNAENNTFLFECWDSRGNYNSRVTTIPMIDYFPLTCNADGAIELSADTAAADIIINLSGNCFGGSFGAVNNELLIDYTVTTTDGEEAYRNVEAITLNGNTYNATVKAERLDYRKAYVVYITASDKISAASTYTKTLQAFPLFDWSNQDFNFNIPINAPAVSVNSEPMIDFIVEQGANSVWTYRKWNSGFCEMWGRVFIMPSANGGDARGGVYYCLYSPRDDISFPFNFVSTPYIQATISNTSTYCALCYCGATTSGLGQIICSRGNNDFYGTELDIYFRGTWK